MSVASVGGRLRGYGRSLTAYGRNLTAYGRSLTGRISAGDRCALLQISGLSAVAFLAVYGIFVATPPGQWVDVQVFGLAQKATQGPLTSWLPALGRRVLPPSLAAAGALLSLVALVQRRWREVGFAALTASVSTALAPALRLRALERPDYGGLGYAHNTLPSTHMAAACSLLVGAVVLWTPPRSPWVLGTAFLLGVLAAVGNVVGYAHLPSDVLASVLMVGAVATLAGAVCGLPRGSAGAATPCEGGTTAVS